jgi:hypothetical protein
MARLVTPRGPFASFEHACDETQGCRAVEVEPALTAEAPFQELRLITLPGGDDRGRCAIALRTRAGWFLATQEDGAICVEPSYVEVSAATATSTDGVVVLEVTVDHHTKDGDDSGEHVWASACGVTAMGPWCTTHLTTTCDPYVCVDDTERWTRTLDVLDGPVLSLTTTSASPAARRDTGTFRLPR